MRWLHHPGPDGTVAADRAPKEALTMGCSISVPIRHDDRWRECVLAFWPLVLLLSCSPAAMPCKYLNTAGPEHWTGTFQLTSSGVMHMGTIDVTVATDMLVDEPSPQSGDEADTYHCSALATGTMTFDDGRVIQLTGAKPINLVCCGGSNVRGSAEGGTLELRGGGYFLADTEIHYPGMGPSSGGEIDINGNKDHVGHWEIHE
jgi:hypothetical protein